MRVRTSLLQFMAAAAIAAGSATAAVAADPIKLGLIEDISGDLAPYGLPKLHGSLLAVDEINKAGGIMGRQIQMTHLDPQGDNARYQEFARRLLEKEHVDVLIGGETSASREAIRPIVDKDNAFYFYTNQYEGGVCDANEISTGASALSLAVASASSPPAPPAATSASRSESMFASRRKPRPATFILPHSIARPDVPPPRT